MEVARVGGGLTDELRNHITEMVENDAVSCDNPRVLEVQAHELFPSGKMRYPNFIRWRVDKGPSQCTRVLKIVPTKVASRSKKSDKKGITMMKTSQYIESSIDDWI